MEKSKRTTFPAYRKIAMEIARDIADGKYTEGQKLSGRTVLSSQYGVSPETIRKAVYLLKDVGILDVKKNSGVLICSVHEAAAFVQQARETQSVSNIKGELFAWMERQINETAAAMEKMQYVINTSERLKRSTPFTPYEVVVPPNSPAGGKSISEINFWHKTGATIIAIERGEQTILSPGPYSSLQVGDILYIIGDDRALHSSIRFVTAGDDIE